MGIERSRRVRNVFGMRVCNYHKGVRDFLEKNPFVFVDQKKLKGLISVEQDHPLTPAEVQFLVKTYSIPGLDCLVTASDQGFTQEARELAHSGSTQRIQLVSTKENPFPQGFHSLLGE